MKMSDFLVYRSVFRFIYRFSTCFYVQFKFWMKNDKTIGFSGLSLNFYGLSHDFSDFIFFQNFPIFQNK
jgi:hypothetical protein